MAWNNPRDEQQKPQNARRPGVEQWLAALRQQLGGGGGGRYAGLVVVALVLLAIFGSYYQVDASERGIVQRFGRFVRLGMPGGNWRWPWPIETVTRVNVSNVDGVPFQSRVLTSDVNLVDINVAIQYQFADPVKVLFQVRSPQETLHDVSESAIREVIGRNTLDAVLAGASRRAITDGTKDLIQQTLDRYNSGIAIKSVNLTGVKVPDQVEAAQQDANKAIEDAERYSKEAQAYENDILPRAQGDAQRQLLDAAAYKQQIVASAEGDAARFSQLATQYAAAPEVTRNRLYLETMESIYSRSRKVVIDARSGNNNLIYLPLDRLMSTGAGRGTTSGVSVEPVPDSSARGAADSASGSISDLRSRQSEGGR